MSIGSIVKLVIVMAIWTPKSHNFCQILALFLVRNSFHLFNQRSIVSPYNNEPFLCSVDNSTVRLSLYT